MRKIRRKFSKWIIKKTTNIQIFPFPLFFLWGDTHYKIKGPEQEVMLGLLKKGDILFRRHDNYLTTMFIKGHYKHAALYVGDGKVIHATTDGVQEENIYTFFRADEVCIARVTEASEQEIEDACERAKLVLNYDYDYLFETGNSNTFYCSELVQNCYPKYLKYTEDKLTPDTLYNDSSLTIVHESRLWRI